ncbi:TerB family tellurite resistance protein [Maribacter sp. MMG018]|nr:TerB family tellurite resistance protein [Maribacter sp. MMG018]
MEFDISEKLAIVNVIDAVIYADGQVHKGEINAFAQLMKVLDFDTNFLIQARNLDREQSIELLKNLSLEKKEFLSKRMKEVAQSDGFVHHKEIEIIEQVLGAI